MGTAAGGFHFSLMRFSTNETRNCYDCEKVFETDCGGPQRFHLAALLTAGRSAQIV